MELVWFCASISLVISTIFACGLSNTTSKQGGDKLAEPEIYANSVETDVHLIISPHKPGTVATLLQLAYQRPSTYKNFTIEETEASRNSDEELDEFDYYYMFKLLHCLACSNAEICWSMLPTRGLKQAWLRFCTEASITASSKNTTPQPSIFIVPNSGLTSGTSMSEVITDLFSEYLQVPNTAPHVIFYSTSLARENKIRKAYKGRAEFMLSDSVTSLYHAMVLKGLFPKITLLHLSTTTTTARTTTTTIYNQRHTDTWQRGFKFIRKHFMR